MTRQMQHYRVCQICGRAIEAAEAEADGWLVSPYVDDPSIFVVRCYRHWSEWSLRRSAMGRTNAARQKMREGKERAEREGPGSIHPFNEPFPLVDEPA